MRAHDTAEGGWRMKTSDGATTTIHSFDATTVPERTPNLSPWRPTPLLNTYMYEYRVF